MTLQLQVLNVLGHALGFWHEQARFDRDQRVRIIEKNVRMGSLGNFLKLDRSEMTTLGIPYDYGSALHYGPNVSKH